jgi:hypothetical protein
MMSVCPAAGYCWGNEGHEIVALVAEHYLNPGVRAKAAALLARDSSGLTPTTGIADEATWADRYRDSDRNTTGQRYRQTREWHFINIEVARPDIDAACYHHPALRPGSNASEGPATDCILDKIEQFHHELRSATTTPEERRLALQFLLHFVGDVHQPLHAADARDRGGNDLRVKTATSPTGSLHHYWDTVFVERLGTRSDAVAAKLVARISADQRRTWSSGSPADWAKESFEIARTHVYGKLPGSNARAYAGAGAGTGVGARADLLLDAGYEADAETVVAIQLQRAGVRLAGLLNDALQ